MMWVLPSGLRTRSSKTGGSLECAWCDSIKLKKIDHYPPDRDVYQCKDCGKKLTYVTTPMPVDSPDRIKTDEEHPYKHIKCGMPRFARIPGLGTFKIRPH